MFRQSAPVILICEQVALPSFSGTFFRRAVGITANGTTDSRSISIYDVNQKVHINLAEVIMSISDCLVITNVLETNPSSAIDDGTGLEAVVLEEENSDLNKAAEEGGLKILQETSNRE